MINAINVQQPLSVIGINKDCIAIYGANPCPQEGGSLLMYNTQFNVVESKQFFKIYFNNSRLWVEDKYIFLAYGQTLAVVQFRISREQLSDMVGSQQALEQKTPIDTECINCDGDLEDMLRFDPEMSRHQNIKDEFNDSIEKEKALQNGTSNLVHNHVNGFGVPIKSVYNEESFDNAIRNIYQYDIDLEVIRDKTLLPDMVQLNISSNVRDVPFTIDAIQLLTAELERSGFGEIAITDYVVPVLIKADASDELITCLRKYTNISEKCLIESVKYFIDKQKASLNDETTIQMDPNLNTVLSCSFDEDHIRDHIRGCLKFDDVLYLLDYLYATLKSEDVQLEERPQNGDHFDDDQQLIKWFTVIIDAYFHQFIMSRDSTLLKSLLKWKGIIDEYVIDLQSLKSIEASFNNLIEGKSIKDKHGSKWYSIEEVKLY